MGRASTHAEADRAVAARSGRRLRILHVVVQAGPTNSQWNEHCLPTADERDVVVCSLFPATVPADPRIELTQGDGTVAGAMHALRRTLARGGYDVVHVHAPASAAMLLVACLLERRSRRDVVFTLHNSWPNLRRRNRLLAALAIAFFPRVVCCSRSAAASVPGPVRRFARNGLEVVPNGVDLARVDRARATTPVGGGSTDRDEDFTFVTVGRLIPIKDQQLLLRAFARVAGPRDRLVLVGEGPLQHRLEELAVSLGAGDRVTFTGLLPRDDVYRVLASADVFVSPSHGEGLPVSVMEAMATAMPVVLSDIAPHRELLEEGSGPVLTPVGDVTGLSGAMRRLRQASAARRAAVGASCRRQVEERFSLTAMSRGYGRLYTEIAGSARRPHGGRDRRAAEGEPMRDTLDLDEVAGGVRSRAWLVLLLALVGGGVGFAMSATLPVVHRAEATLLVGPTHGMVTKSSTVNASEQLAAFYADMARRELVLRPVAERLGLRESWVTLRDHVSAVVPQENPRLVTVRVMGGSQDQVLREANAIVQKVTSLSPAPSDDEQTFVNAQVTDLKQSIEQGQQHLRDLQELADSATKPASRQALQDQIGHEQTVLSGKLKDYVALVDAEPTADAGGLQLLDHATPVTGEARSGAVKLTLVGALGGAMVGGLCAWLLHRRQRRRLRNRAPGAPVTDPVGPAEADEPQDDAAATRLP